VEFTQSVSVPILDPSAGAGADMVRMVADGLVKTLEETGCGLRSATFQVSNRDGRRFLECRVVTDAGNHLGGMWSFESGGE
jgi:hypothetical protein